MSYENAPATKMVATHCACCELPLVDAKSVECGVGPVCRKKHGFDIEVSEDARKEANKLVYGIALQRTGPEVIVALKRLFELGFTQLVLAILKRIATVRIAITDDAHPHGAGRLAVVAPYSEHAVAVLKGIPGRRWFDPKKQTNPDAFKGWEKANTFPMESKAALWDALQKLYPGATGVGPKGPFIFAATQPVALKVTVGG